jgi:signal transduction histidine kinase
VAILRSYAPGSSAQRPASGLEDAYALCAIIFATNAVLLSFRWCGHPRLSGECTCCVYACFCLASTSLSALQWLVTLSSSICTLRLQGQALDCRTKCRISCTNGQRARVALPTTYLLLLLAASYTALCLGCSAAPLLATQRLFALPAVLWLLALLSQRSTRQTVCVAALGFAASLPEAAAFVLDLSWKAQTACLALRCAPLPLLSQHVWQMVTAAALKRTLQLSLVHVAFSRLVALAALQLPTLAALAAVDGAVTSHLAALLSCAADVLLYAVLPLLALEMDGASGPPSGTPAHGRGSAHPLNARAIMQRMLAMERKNQVLAAMRNSLREPLALIASGESVLQQPEDGKVGDAQESDVVVTIRALSSTLLLRMDALFTAEAFASGSASICHESVDCRDVACSAAAHAAPAVLDGVRVTLRTHAVPRIIGDDACVMQALYALVERAVAITREGTVTLGAGYLADEDRVYLYVRDCGGGMSAEEAGGLLGAGVEHGGGGWWGARLVRDVVAAHRCAAVAASVHQLRLLRLWRASPPSLDVLPIQCHCPGSSRPTYISTSLVLRAQRKVAFKRGTNSRCRCAGAASRCAARSATARSSPCCCQSCSSRPPTHPRPAASRSTSTTSPI